MTASDLRALFRVERILFDLPDAVLKISDRVCVPESPCRDRDVAWCSDDTVWILRRALGLPKRNLLAVVRHELGHLADPTPSRRGAERRADRVARLMTGQTIRYNREGLQTLGPGGPRPARLHH